MWKDKELPEETLRWGDLYIPSTPPAEDIIICDGGGVLRVEQSPNFREKRYLVAELCGGEILLTEFEDTNLIERICQVDMEYQLKKRVLMKLLPSWHEEAIRLVIERPDLCYKQRVEIHTLTQKVLELSVKGEALIVLEHNERYKIEHEEGLGTIPLEGRLIDVLQSIERPERVHMPFDVWMTRDGVIYQYQWQEGVVELPL